MKPDTLTDEQRKALRPFTYTFDGMLKELKSLSDEQLQELLNAANDASETNCWFVIYEASQWLRPKIEEMMKLRKKEKALRIASR